MPARWDTVNTASMSVRNAAVEYGRAQDAIKGRIEQQKQKQQAAGAASADAPGAAAAAGGGSASATEQPDSPDVFRSKFEMLRKRPWLSCRQPFADHAAPGGALPQPHRVPCG